MNSGRSNRKLWLVDRQEHQGRVATAILQTAGFDVEVFHDYGDLANPQRAAARAPELVILSCARVDDDERRLLRRLVGKGLPVVFVVDSVSVGEIRDLFRAGARDIERMPDDPEQLLATIEKNLWRIRDERERPRVWMKTAM